ncbi:MAG TPA: hypothetical protein PLP99_04155 [Ignavibacteriales bacterium]|nr:hypothetical protein [Ignavibacteriales bacterium]HOL80936.1 hypothetical protein [Ignavibacteriales bacterium]HOM64672.1 hypothetical protein [Ignavibacteriales bacterium]HPP32717.1 hypothetical protein [Ignavibacteriales bacterium]HRR18181.1 hypothetical protein [Ignavibacteriales bacterium]
MFLVISSTIAIITGNLTTQENLILNAQELKYLVMQIIMIGLDYSQMIKLKW